jgi:tRNA (mo5U34)-methyltransferase
LPGGEVTPGQKPLQWIETEAGIYFKHGVAGKSVLDIGAWDGAFSFAAERQGAQDVLATDHFCWTGRGWAGRATKAAFDYAHSRLQSKVRSQIIDVPDIHAGSDRRAVRCRAYPRGALSRQKSIGLS